MPMSTHLNPPPTLTTLSGVEPIRLSKVVMQLVGCSRNQAEQYIEGGWVSVEGQVVEEPFFKVTTQKVELAPDAQLTPSQPVTLLVHKVAGVSMEEIVSEKYLNTNTRWMMHTTKIVPVNRHFKKQVPLLPLETSASGLVLVSQEARIIRKVNLDAERIEQEYSVEVAEPLSTTQLRVLQTGSTRAHSAVRHKVSWQNETHLRFALKGAHVGQIEELLALIDIKPLSLKRLRLGRIPLSSLPVGYWRYAATWERI